MKVSPYVVAAALLLSGTAATLHAEPREKKDGSRWSHEGRGERMKEALGLSEEQRGKLKALRRAHRDATEELRGKLKAGMRKLSDQLEDEAGDKELSATLESIASSRQALARERERFEKEMGALLTPTQRAKLLAGRMKLAKGHGRRFGHGRGSGRGDGHDRD
jgi:Spy/CpxP family protein refolding chaperone